MIMPTARDIASPFPGLCVNRTTLVNVHHFHIFSPEPTSDVREKRIILLHLSILCMTWQSDIDITKQRMCRAAAMTG